MANTRGPARLYAGNVIPHHRKVLVLKANTAILEHQVVIHNVRSLMNLRSAEPLPVLPKLPGAFLLCLLLSFAAHWAMLDLAVGGPISVAIAKKKSNVANVPSALIVSLAPTEKAIAKVDPAMEGDLAKILQSPSSPKSGLLASKENVYFRRRDLTVSPRMLGELRIVAPTIQKGHPVVSIKARVFLDETGRPEMVRIEDKWVQEDIAQAAIKALEAVRFSPGEIRGEPVKSQILIGLEFVAREKSLDELSGR